MISIQIGGLDILKGIILDLPLFNFIGCYSFAQIRSNQKVIFDKSNSNVVDSAFSFQNLTTVDIEESTSIELHVVTYTLFVNLFDDCKALSNVLSKMKLVRIYKMDF
jgi:hypothetical protein